MSAQRLDVRNIQPIAGPFTVAEAHPPTPDTGGILDRGIVGRLPDGTKVVIGEIWAACPDDNHRKVSIDTDEMALRIVTALNCHDDLLDALTALVNAITGATDASDMLARLTHGPAAMARDAIAKATGQAVTS